MRNSGVTSYNCHADPQALTSRLYTFLACPFILLVSISIIVASSHTQFAVALPILQLSLLQAVLDHLNAASSTPSSLSPRLYAHHCRFLLILVGIFVKRKLCSRRRQSCLPVKPSFVCLCRWFHAWWLKGRARPARQIRAIRWQGRRQNAKWKVPWVIIWIRAVNKKQCIDWVMTGFGLNLV